MQQVVLSFLINTWQIFKAMIFESSCHTPVLLLVYNRPAFTAKVLAAVRAAQPATLLVAADGPVGDPKCQEVRELVMQGIDWPCHVHTRFSPTRLGCRKAISQALDWGFAGHERLIVIEDDCLPESSFFRFCTELLERYQDDDKVMQICGSNLSGHVAQDGSSYYSSRFATIWGWASWRRAWKHHDAAMRKWQEHRSTTRWKASCKFRGEAAWRKKLYDSACPGDIDAWSIAWEFARQARDGVSLISSVNLVSNLGWGQEATHTHDAHDPRASMQTNPISFPLQHPGSLEPNDQADRAYFNRYCRPPSLLSRIRRKIWRKWRTMMR